MTPIMIAELISHRIAVATSFQITAWLIHAIGSCLGLDQTSVLTMSAMVVNPRAPKVTSGAVITAREKEFNKMKSTCISSSQCVGKTRKAKNHLRHRLIRLIPPTLTSESSTASSLDPFDEYEGTVDDCPTARCADSACARFEAHFDKTDEFGIGGDFVPKVNDMSECALLLLTRSPSSFDDADLTAAS